MGEEGLQVSREAVTVIQEEILSRRRIGFENFPVLPLDQHMVVELVIQILLV